MKGKFLLAWVVAFVVSMLGGFVVHGTLLHAEYQKLTGLFRSETEAQAYFPWMLLAHVILAGAFLWIYSRGIEQRPWLGQGVLYWVALACLTAIPIYLMHRKGKLFSATQRDLVAAVQAGVEARHTVVAA